MVIKEKTIIIFLFLLLLLIITSSDIFAQRVSGTPGQTQLLQYGSNGELVYSPINSQGDIIPDFSGVGYKNSDEAIPTSIPIVRTVTAVSGDNTSNIQNAINIVGDLPVQSNGFRGAILFRAGTYNIYNTINITKSGIVLYGEGSGSTGTIFRANQTKSYDIINIKGPGTISTDKAERQVHGSYVPIGSKALTIGSGHNFQVGNWITVHHVVNQAWIDLLGMDDLSSIKSTAKDWVPADYDYFLERQITGINGNTIYMDAPIFDPIDSRYSTAYLSKVTGSSRLENVGIENIRFVSTYTSSTDDKHGRNAVTFQNAKNCWAKNLEVYYFAYSAVRMLDGTIFITVDNCKMYDPKSPPEGGNRYPFVIEGQRGLVKNCYARQGRHDYAMGSHTLGPNVVTNCVSEDVVINCDIGPHQRWSVGTLFDRVVTDMDINVQNRGVSGTGHGWAGSQMMLWNCKARKMVVQNPPSNHNNWVIGCSGTITNCAQYCNQFPESIGWVESAGTPISAIPSLFEAQLKDRHNQGGGGTPTPVWVHNGPTTFNGTTDYVSGTRSSGSASNLTVAFFMTADKLASMGVVDKLPLTGSAGWSVKLRSNGDLWFRVGSEGTRTDARKTAVYSAGTRVHIACTFGSGTAKIYVNGSLVTTLNGITYGVNNTSTTLRLGIPSVAATSNIFDGKLEQVKIYHQVLTATEIKMISRF